MAYTAFDRFVAQWRFRAAFPYIRPKSRVCDIGCGLDAQFLRWARARIVYGVGLDYQVSDSEAKDIPIVRCDISRSLPLRDSFFDHAVMLAVLEHLGDPTATLKETFRILAPGGSLILTWPDQAVDPLLNLLHRVHLISDAMESQKHERRLPMGDLLSLLRGIGFGRLIHRTFELGVNNLLVAVKGF
jgi:ubiquinone/menaquinone biosynthesis C-methylase UbiE